MKVVIAGGRDVGFDDAWAGIVLSFRDTKWVPVEVVSGGASGVDSVAKQYADYEGIPFKLFAADWDGLGRKAGPIRNQQMAEYGDCLIAVWDGKSRGTYNMISQMRLLNKPVHIHILEPK